ncbi:MAG: Do family serine endopeptidase [Gammaproteobacteria bacterium]|nr:Do family serine endopeptidase [Gammaproteobacteria bacterium]
MVAAMLLEPAQSALPAEVDGEAMPTLAPMIERVTPAVVNIATSANVEAQANPLFNDPFFRRFFNIPELPRRRAQASGSGVIVDAKRGLLLTNNHVIANADDIQVKLRDGRIFEAELVGTDPDTDIAVIRIKADGLTEIQIADSSKVRVGDFVVAIGNPFGLGQTVTSGIISALARSGLGIVGYEDFIQTDASINPGNSGGALVNLRGELVGINSAILSQSGGNVGIGFAVPSNMASQIMEQLVQYGEVRRGFLGVEMQDLDPALAEAFGLKQHEGAVVVSVVPESSAAAAGLQAGDVVTRANRVQIRNAADLRNQIGLLRVGDSMELTFLREGRERRASVTVNENPAIATGGELRNERLAGANFGEISPQSRAYGRYQGVMVYDVDVGSEIWRAGVRPGDIIRAVNRVATPTLKAFLEVVNNARGSLLLQIQRGNAAALVVIK